jgi:hypothetical protein
MSERPGMRGEEREESKLWEFFFEILMEAFLKMKWVFVLMTTR